MFASAQWLLVAGWLVVVPLFAGWGALVRWLWRIPVRADLGDLLGCFWLGWASVLLILQLWHFLLPVDAAAQLVFVAGGLLGLALLAPPSLWLARRLPRALPLLVALALSAAWLSNRAMEGSRFGDTGGYYVPAIRWVIEHPVVIGLANLYPPYAYNQSYFLYAAVLDSGPFAGRTHHLLNSTLIAVLAARTLLGLWRLRRRDTAGPDDVFYALMLPAEVEAACGFLLTSPAPDFAVYALGIALTGKLVALLASPAPPPPDRLRLHFLSLALLAALAPTIKVPMVGLAGGAMLVAIVVWCRRMRDRRAMVKGLAIVAALGVLAIGPWIAGNVLMSGCPLFPSAVGALPVPWRVDWDVEKWIHNTMIIGDWRVALRSPGWVAQRFVAFGWTAWSVIVPLGIAVAALVLGGVGAAVRRLRRSAARDARMPASLLLAPLASLAACIALTPVPRYAGATVWLIAATSVMVALGRGLLSPRARGTMALGAVALAALPFVTGAALWLNLRDFPPSPGPMVEPQRLVSGLEVYVPSPRNPSCWSAPLPCTPRLHPGLKLRHPPDLGSGFEADPALGPPAELKLG